MPTPKLGGQNFIDKRREIDPQRLFRDARPLSQRFFDYIDSHQNVGIILLILTGVIWFFPAFVPLVLIVVPLAVWWIREHPEGLPLRLPSAANCPDPTDPEIGRKGYRKARGILYLGNDMVTGEECWASREDMLTHMLFFGTTGAGKTFTLTGLAANFLCMGGGLIYTDAKAAASLALDIHAIACGLGRDDDFLVLNFITGSEIINSRSRNRISNSMNFMARGAASSIGDILTSLLPGDDGGSNSVFKDQALSLLRGVLPALVDLRDAGKITLGANTLREWVFSMENLMKLSDKCKMESGKPSKIENADLQSVIRPEAMESLNAYLGGIPGFSFSQKPSEQGEKTREQFGYAKMYWNRVMSIFADDYRHLFWADVADVDNADVIRQRRILVTLLPALEKSPADLKSIGNIVLSALKQAVSTMLPSNLTGPRGYLDIPMPACPAGVVLDEYAYITTEGFAVLPAQARGLGVSLCFAGQDYPGFKRANEKEAGQTIGNTNIKVIMKLEDSTDTWQLVKEMAGDAFVSQTGGFSVSNGPVGGYQDNLNASIEMRSRLTLGDLKSFIEGECFLFFQNRIVRMFLFSHNVKKNRKSLFNVHEFLPLRVSDGAASGKSSDLADFPGDVFKIEECVDLWWKKRDSKLEPDDQRLIQFGLPSSPYKDWLRIQESFDALDAQADAFARNTTPTAFLERMAMGLFAQVDRIQGGDTAGGGAPNESSDEPTKSEDSERSKAGGSGGGARPADERTAANASPVEAKPEAGDGQYDLSSVFEDLEKGKAEASPSQGTVAETEGQGSDAPADPAGMGGESSADDTSSSSEYDPLEMLSNIAKITFGADIDAAGGPAPSVSLSQALEEAKNDIYPELPPKPPEERTSDMDERLRRYQEEMDSLLRSGV